MNLARAAGAFGSLAIFFLLTGVVSIVAGLDYKLYALVGFDAFWVVCWGLLPATIAEPLGLVALLRLRKMRAAGQSHVSYFPAVLALASGPLILVTLIVLAFSDALHLSPK